MAPVLKTGIDKKTIEGSNPSLSFCFSTIAFTGPIKKKENSSAVYSRATRIQLEKEYLKRLSLRSLKAC